MMTQMAGTWITGGVIAAVIFVAAVAAEGRGVYLLRLWLLHGRGERLAALRQAELERERNSLAIVRELGASERRYAELASRRERARRRDTAERESSEAA